MQINLAVKLTTKCQADVKMMIADEMELTPGSISLKTFVVSAAEFV